MSIVLQKIEADQIKKLTSNKRIPAFRAGDTIKTVLKIVEGERTRLQAFEGVCIARKNNGLNSNYTIRKMSHGEGVERVFPLFSPIIDKIEVIRKGDVRRSKLYYLRDRTGKRARISDRDRGDEADQYELIQTINKDIDDKNTEDRKDNNNTINQAVDSSENTKKTTIEKKDSIEEKSESAAKGAEKTDNESKS